jgi:hypothetical protein
MAISVSPACPVTGRSMARAISSDRGLEIGLMYVQEYSLGGKD